jgi:hypothetical protein
MTAMAHGPRGAFISVILISLKSCLVISLKTCLLGSLESCLVGECMSVEVQMALGHGQWSGRRVAGNPPIRAAGQPAPG